MKYILAFAGSNSSTSINKQLVTYSSKLLSDKEIRLIDLNDFEMPIYSADRENENGLPDKAHQFVELIKNSDGIMLSLAEHNGAYTTAFKNIFDWSSRVASKTFFNKPMLLMATSPGGRGGASVLDMAKNRFPFHDANIIDTFSLPSFNDNFSEGKVTNKNFQEELFSKIKKFEKAL